MDSSFSAADLSELLVQSIQLLIVQGTSLMQVYINTTDIEEYDTNITFIVAIEIFSI